MTQGHPMPTPPDHAELLKRTDYPVPPAAPLTDAERRIVARFGYWMEGLAVGAIAPATPDQEHFVLAVRGMEDPTSEFERAWVKARESSPAPAAPPASLADAARRLEETRAAFLAAQQEYAFRQMDVMAKVRPELDALDAELLPRVKALQQEMADLEATLKDGVRAGGRSFYHRGFRVLYSKGRVTFDAKGLQQYAVTHPEVNRFRKVGQPVVSLRYSSPGDPVAPPPESESTAVTDGHDH